MSTKPTDYKNIEFKLYEHLVQIHNMLVMMDADAEHLYIIEKNKELIKSKKYNIAVMGEFKRGKSSLINALLGLDILPADVTPATATINRITFGSQLKAEIVFFDGTKQSVDVKDMKQYVTKLTSEANENSSKISEAIIYTPAILCQNHVDIIDTPGLNDTDIRMQKVSFEFLHKSDAVIFCIHACYPFSDTELKFLCQLIKTQNVNNIIFVVTFIDLIDEDEQDILLDYLKSQIFLRVTEKLEKEGESQQTIDKARVLLNNLSIFAVSSSLALKYFITNDKETIKKSKFYHFKTELMKIITAKQVENAVNNVVSDIQTVLSKLNTNYDNKMKEINEESILFEQTRIYAEQFFTNSTKFLYKLFIDVNKPIENKINNLKNTESNIAKEFIKSLSSLTLFDTTIIKETILNTAIIVLKNFNDIHLKNVKDYLKETYQQIINQYIRITYDELQKNLSPLDIDYKLLPPPANFLELENIKFKWVDALIPNNSTEYIDHISQVIDLSILDLIKNLNDVADTCRGYIFQNIKNQAEMLKINTQKKEIELKKKLPLKLEAYSQNYERFKDTAKDIIYSSQIIAGEYTSINRKGEK